jgi:hypothetical protein
MSSSSSPWTAAFANASPIETRFREEIVRFPLPQTAQIAGQFMRDIVVIAASASNCSEMLVLKTKAILGGMVAIGLKSAHPLTSPFQWVHCLAASEDPFVELETIDGVDITEVEFLTYQSMLISSIMKFSSSESAEHHFLDRLDDLSDRMTTLLKAAIVGWDAGLEPSVSKPGRLTPKRGIKSKMKMDDFAILKPVYRLFVTTANESELSNNPYFSGELINDKNAGKCAEMWREDHPFASFYKSLFARLCRDIESRTLDGFSRVTTTSSTASEVTESNQSVSPTSFADSRRAYPVFGDVDYDLFFPAMSRLELKKNDSEQQQGLLQLVVDYQNERFRRQGSKKTATVDSLRRQFEYDTMLRGVGESFCECFKCIEHVETTPVWVDAMWILTAKSKRVERAIGTHKCFWFVLLLRRLLKTAHPSLLDRGFAPLNGGGGGGGGSSSGTALVMSDDSVATKTKRGRHTMSMAIKQQEIYTRLSSSPTFLLVERIFPFLYERFKLMVEKNLIADMARDKLMAKYFIHKSESLAVTEAVTPRIVKRPKTATDEADEADYSTYSTYSTSSTPRQKVAYGTEGENFLLQIDSAVVEKGINATFADTVITDITDSTDSTDPADVTDTADIQSLTNARWEDTRRNLLWLAHESRVPTTQLKRFVSNASAALDRIAKRVEALRENRRTLSDIYNALIEASDEAARRSGLLQTSQHTTADTVAMNESRDAAVKRCTKVAIEKFQQANRFFSSTTVNSYEVQQRLGFKKKNGEKIDAFDPCKQPQIDSDYNAAVNEIQTIRALIESYRSLLNDENNEAFFDFSKCICNEINSFVGDGTAPRQPLKTVTSINSFHPIHGLAWTQARITAMLTHRGAFERRIFDVIKEGFKLILALCGFDCKPGGFQLPGCRTERTAAGCKFLFQFLTICHVFGELELFYTRADYESQTASSSPRRRLLSIFLSTTENVQHFRLAESREELSAVLDADQSKWKTICLLANCAFDALCYDKSSSTSCENILFGRDDSALFFHRSGLVVEIRESRDMQQPLRWLEDCYANCGFPESRNWSFANIRNAADVFTLGKICPTVIGTSGVFPIPTAQQRPRSDPLSFAAKGALIRKDVDRHNLEYVFKNAEFVSDEAAEEGDECVVDGADTPELLLAKTTNADCGEKRDS